MAFYESPFFRMTSPNLGRRLLRMIMNASVISLPVEPFINHRYPVSPAIFSLEVLVHVIKA